MVKRFPAPTFGSCATRRRADNERCSRLATARRTIAGSIASTDSSRVNTSWRLRLATRGWPTRSGCARKSKRCARPPRTWATRAPPRRASSCSKGFRQYRLRSLPQRRMNRRQATRPSTIPARRRRQAPHRSTWVLPKKRVASTSSCKSFQSPTSKASSSPRRDRRRRTFSSRWSTSASRSRASAATRRRGWIVTAASGSPTLHRGNTCSSRAERLADETRARSRCRRSRSDGRQWPAAAPTRRRQTTRRACGRWPTSRLTVATSRISFSHCSRA